MRFTIAALYRFADVPDPVALQARMSARCEQGGVKGTLLIAPEGVNGTLAGSAEGISAVVAALEGEGFAPLDVKYSLAETPPFPRLKVRLKREIVTLGVPGVDAANDAGTYVEPRDWNALIDAPETVVIDTRNDYEVRLGTFEGALDPETKSFGELPDWVDTSLDVAKDTPIAMFCTGGIRCEKSTALLKAKGFTNVHHLKGGILKYLEEVPEEDSRFDGRCFVFDERVSVGHGLVVGDDVLCYGCKMPLTALEQASPLYEPGIACPHCADTITTEQRTRFANRQAQIDRQRASGREHLAVNLEVERARKRAEREAQRARSRAGR
ncbi:MAG: rhodanese-related sulfurtransferase [Pseudomonadota bacterium]